MSLNFEHPVCGWTPNMYIKGSRLLGFLGAQIWYISSSKPPESSHPSSTLSTTLSLRDGILTSTTKVVKARAGYALDFLQIPCPHSNIHVNIYPSRLCMKMSSFLCVHGQCRVYYIYHMEFYFQFGHLITYPVWHQLLCGCRGEKSSKQAQLRLCKLGLGTVLIFYKYFAPTPIYL